MMAQERCPRCSIASVEGADCAESEGAEIAIAISAKSPLDHLGPIKAAFEHALLQHCQTVTGSVLVHSLSCCCRWHLSREDGMTSQNFLLLPACHVKENLLLFSPEISGSRPCALVISRLPVRSLFFLLAA